MVTTSLLRSLCSANGPGYLLHALEVLRELGVPEANVRLVPVLGHYGGSEVLPYEAPRHPLDAEPAPLEPASLSVRLDVNVRADNRLQRYRPLVAVGLPPAEALAAGDVDAGSLADRVRQWCEQHYGELHALEPDWAMGERPCDRLVRQLCEQYPEMTELVTTPLRESTGYVRAGAFEPDYRGDEDPLAKRPAPRHTRGEETGEADRAAPKGVAQELVELFFTHALTAVATADLFGSFEFLHRVQPDGRAIGITIGSQSRLDDVVTWLSLYPHYARPEVSYPEPDDLERQQWERQLLGQRERDNVFETERRAWTGDDPAVKAIYQEIRRQYRTGRTEDMTATELIGLAERHLPDWVPNYPRQASVTTGLNLGGITVSLFKQWLEEGPVLGITKEDLALFEPHREALFWALLLRRRHTDDFRSLFELAARLLVHPEVEVDQERFVPHPHGLGSPLAQPGRTLALDGRSVLHSPEVVVHLPVDRTSGEAADAMERRLEILRRVFIPAHVPIRYEWDVRWVNIHHPPYPLNPVAARGGLTGDLSGYLRGSGTTLFTVREIRNPVSLARKLRDGADPLSAHLREQLSEETLLRLEEHDEANAPSVSLLTLLVDDLNEVLNGESLYREERFAHVALSARTRALIARDPRGPALLHLNRFLLQEAYPEELAESEALAYWAHLRDDPRDEENAR